MKYNDDHNNVVTIFSRKKLRPNIDDKTRETSGHVPPEIYFVMPDGSEHAIDLEQDVVIGRQPRPDDPPVTLDLETYDGHELGVSRHHCMMKKINGNLILVDLDSINGTFLNGDRAIPLKRYNIKDGDTITIGRLTLEIRFQSRRRR